MAGLDDEFNYIYTADFSQVIVYSKNGRVYYTECDIISSYDLIQNHSCSKYVGVTFQLKFEQSQGFMSKQSIIRMSINSEENCVFSKTQVDFKNYNNEYKLYKKDNKVAISSRNDSINPIDFEKQNPVIELYDDVFYSSLPKLLRDVFVSIYAIFFVVVCLYKAIKSRQTLLLLFKDIAINLKKFCCWCCRPQLIQPTTAMEIGKSQNNLPHTIYNLPPVPSAPSETPMAYRPFTPLSYADPNVYHTIGKFPNVHSQFSGANSASSLYQQRMPTRSCTTLNIKEEPYESTGELLVCPICPQDPPKLCKGQTGLAQHMSRTHKIK